MNQGEEHRNWTAAELSAYHHGKLSESEMHALEADALEDPFLADALEGAASLDLVSAGADLDKRWNSGEGGTGTEGSVFTWKLVLYSALALGTVWMLCSVWSSQLEISELRSSIAEEHEENEVLVYQYEDSLMLLEISLAQEIPVAEQLNAIHVIINQEHLERGEEVIEDAQREEISAKEMDTMTSRGYGMGQVGKLNPLLKMREFPTRYIWEFKVADHIPAHPDPEFILPGVLTGTPAAMSTRTDDVDAVGKQVTYHDLLKKALQSFTESDYKNCLVLLDRISERYPRDENAIFYSALCYYNLGKWEKASALFRSAQYHENRVFTEEAEFYRALTKLKAGETDEAMGLFRSIAEKQSFYAARARTYLRE